VVSPDVPKQINTTCPGGTTPHEPNPVEEQLRRVDGHPQRHTSFMNCAPRLDLAQIGYIPGCKFFCVYDTCSQNNSTQVAEYTVST